MEKEILKVQRFSDQMLIELESNKHKGSVLDFTNFQGIITEIEYHKAKMFMAIKLEDRRALKEYIADIANNLLALGNNFKLYEEDSFNDGFQTSLDTEKEFITYVKTESMVKDKGGLNL